MEPTASAVREENRRHRVRTVASPGAWRTTFEWQSGVRTTALVIIAVVVACVAIHIAAPFLIPLVVSLLASYALTPLVHRLQRWYLPRAIGAAIVMFLVIVGASVVMDLMWNGTEALLGQMPAAVEKIRIAIAVSHSDIPNTLTHMQRTATELQRLAGAAPANVDKVAPPPAWSIDWRSVLLIGSSSVVAGIVQLLSIIFLTYFLLAAGDLFRRKLVHLVGPPITRQKITLEVLDHIHRLNQRYLAVVALINVCVGAATAAGLALIGMDHAAVWGVTLAILHVVPYLGAAVVAAAVALAAYLQFGTLQTALAAAAIPLVFSVLIGVFLQAALLGRAARMNAPVVFIALLFWGMLWGAWGLLLAMPMMVAIKSVCNRIEPLNALGKFLGDDEKTI